MYIAVITVNNLLEQMKRKTKQSCMHVNELLKINKDRLKSVNEYRKETELSATRSTACRLRSFNILYSRLL